MYLCISPKEVSKESAIPSISLDLTLFAAALTGLYLAPLASKFWSSEPATTAPLPLSKANLLTLAAVATEDSEAASVPPEAETAAEPTKPTPAASPTEIGS